MTAPSQRATLYSTLITLSLCVVPLLGLASDTGPDLELIMSDPDWIGNAPESPWWGDDSATVYYRAKREGEDIRDTYRVTAGNPAERVTAEQFHRDSGQRRVYSASGSLVAWTSEGDLFYRKLPDGDVQRVTHTVTRESAPLWLADESALAFIRDGRFYIYGLDSALTRQASDIRFEKSPEDLSSFDPLRDQQRRTYSTAVEDERRELAVAAAARASRDGGAATPLEPIFLGDELAEEGRWLSPDGRHLLLAVADKTAQATRNEKQGRMPNYVTLEGPVAVHDVRERVGRRPFLPVEFKLVDLASGEIHDVDTSDLPGRDSDPLRKLRTSAIDWHIAQGADADATRKALEAPERRSLVNPAVAWSPDGSQVAIMAYAADNKDRWLFTLAPAKSRIRLQHRATDEAWINWHYQAFGWLPNGTSLWYMSEESGYNHLYLKALDERRHRALTHGDFVVREPAFNATGDRAWVVANRSHPGEYDVYTVDVSGGDLVRLTEFAGVTEFSLSPDESKLLLSTSRMDRHADLYVTDARQLSEPQQLTDTVSDAYKAIDWVVPEIVEVPSSHTDRPIYSKLYLPPDHDPGKSYPAVMFVHGAGYTQNAHKGWPYYFREFMFHTLLANTGYVVLDMDYRASQGYGRDWRTTIYRNMGHPELEDYLDGKAWLAETQGVDPERVGIYGGSYGGFMTFMALFRAPDEFAAGAALRPVVDWMHYNHGYTSAILNTPAIDPVAYQKSSPINHAEGLKSPLLIAVGMQDDNVFFQDSVLLVQRLLELRKPDFEMAVYPLDGHGFIHADAWLDEYRRIFRLMERHVRGAP